ncbi:MAG: hypothetical protein IE884_02250 [Sulfuricurvum sp.]|nr:hypothetical protein [Sulfuricurvum sp.]
MMQIPLIFWKRAVIGGAIGVLAAGIWVWSEHSRYSQLLEEYQLLQHQTQEYLDLKGRWMFDPSSETASILKTHPKLVRSEKVRGGVLFEFTPLSSTEFDLLSNTILNAPFTIKKLTMKRNPEGKGEIVVEFEG